MVSTGESDSRPTLWLVDGFNVLHSGVLQGPDRQNWWTGPMRARLLARAERFDDPDAELWVVFDGPRAEDRELKGREYDDETTGRVRTVFAPSADAWLVSRVQAAAQPAAVAVVTADRQVAGRARHRGARVVSPREFLARCVP